MRSALKRPRHRLFYGWVIVAAGFLSQMVHAGLATHGFGTFLVVLEQEFGWSKTALAAARSLNQIESGLVDPVAGMLVDRVGPRPLMVAGNFLFGLGLVLFSRVHSLVAYYGVFLLMALGGSLAGIVAISVAINNWFRRKRSLAMSLTLLSLAVGGVVIVPALVWAQTNFGWRGAALASGVCVWMIGIPAALAIRRSPEQYGEVPDGVGIDRPAPSIVGTRRGAEGAGEHDFTLPQALRTRAFWLIGLGHGFSLMVVSAATVHQFAQMEQGVGISRGLAALVVTVLNVASIFGRLVGGFLGDRYPKRYLAAIGLLGSAGALLVLAFATTVAQAMLYGVIHGFCWGLRGPLMSTIKGDYFGRAAFGKIMGFSSVVTTPWSLAGPIFAGFMADLQGSYTAGFVVLSAVSALGAVMFWMARPPEPPASDLRR